MNTSTQWASTLPGDHWVPTMQMVEEHSDRAWRQMRSTGRTARNQPISAPRRIAASRAAARASDMLIVAIAALAFAAGALATVAARGVVW